MTREEIIAFARSLPLVGTDQPFREDFDSTVLRHSDTGKWFGLFMRIPGAKVGRPEAETDILNLKCEPMFAETLTGNYAGVLPAYHMNKYHWITVVLDSDVPNGEICDLVRMSYRLTAPRPKRAAAKKKTD